MANCAVSVIIPLYNAQAYIRECLLSVLASEFADFEVLVVDDCSTDNSVAIVEALQPYAGGRLKIFSTGKNSGGAGIPRNVGIINAQGKYVTFVDNDDLIMPNTLGDFFNVAEAFQAEVVHTERYIVFRDADLDSAKPRLQSDEPHKNFVTEPTFEPEDLSERLARYLDGKIFWLPWGKFYRRDFLLQNDIFFPQMKFSEDLVFCFKCVCLAKRYLRAPLVNNLHRYRETSAAQDYDLKMWLSVLTQVARILDEFMGGQDFFIHNANLRYAVLKFVADKSFSWIRALSKGKPQEVYKFFYDALQNPKLDVRGKDIIDAYLYTERVTNQTK